MSNSSCQIILKKGNNMGKKCGDVNHRCRHTVVKCTVCDRMFYEKSTFSRHKETCRKIKVEVGIKTKFPDIESIIQSAVATALKPYMEKIEMQEIRHNKHLEELKDDIVEIKNIPRNIILNLGLPIDSKGLKALADRMGAEQAMEYLIANADTMTVQKLIGDIYLQGDSMSWPVTCRNAEDPTPHFRYLNLKKEVIEDVGGHKLCKTVIDTAQNVYLSAANNTIELITGEELSEEARNTHICNYQSAQTCAFEISNRSTESDLITHIASRTFNPKHPLWTGVSH